MKDAFNVGASASATVSGSRSTDDRVRMGGIYTTECRDKDGNLKWRDVSHNLVTNAGENYGADVTLSGGSQITTWYVGLMAASPTPADADTMSSHAGWTEFTAYDESVRQTWTDAGPSGGVVTNTASTADFTVSTNSSSIGGAFLTSDSTKSGTSGTLFSAVAFSGGNKAADDGDTLSVTYQFTFADDGA